MVATARSRLAEIEATYTGDQCAVEATQAKLFKLVEQHYQERDRLRSTIRDRRKYLGALLAGREHEAVYTAGPHQRATTEAESNYERTASAAEYRRELGDEAERELRKLWKQLILLYHPDRHTGEADTFDTYVKLMSAINRAKEERDMSRLREIAEDPAGFILRQGWTWSDFGDADEIASLRKLLGRLDAEIVNKLNVLNGLRESSFYELHQLSSARPSLLDEAAAGVAKAISAEITQLEAEAEKLGSEIAKLSGSDEAPF
jgi:DNA polymerase-3 subunit epsilon